MIAERIVATLLEDDFDPTSEIDTLLPYGRWHDVHGVKTADVRAWFRQWGMKVTYIHKSKKHGSLSGSFSDASEMLSNAPNTKNERGEWVMGQAYWDRQELERLFTYFVMSKGSDMESNIWFDDENKVGYFDIYNGAWMREMRARNEQEQKRRQGQKQDRERTGLWDA